MITKIRKKRIEEILNSATKIVEKNTVPDTDEQFTYENGIKTWVGALFIDIVNSNMLAFMDLLKYQMSSKATMEQLFFITCDDRISKLLKYKLSGREIELCELLEADFV